MSGLLLVLADLQLERVDPLQVDFVDLPELPTALPNGIHKLTDLGLASVEQQLTCIDLSDAL